MRTILTALFLCLAILIGIAETASGAITLHGQKTASGIFGENPNICTYKLGSLELEPCWGDTIVGYDSATGVLSYVRQNPWSSFDPLGLDEKEVNATKKTLSNRDDAKRKIDEKLTLKDVPSSLRIKKEIKMKEGDPNDSMNYGFTFDLIEGTAKVEAYIREKLVNDVITLGTKGGEIGFAMANRILHGEPIEIGFADAAHVDGGNDLFLNPNARNWAKDISRFDTRVGIESQLQNGPKGSSVTLSHEFGHLMIGVADPFNVNHVENPIRNSMGLSRRNKWNHTNLALYRDQDSRKWGNPQGNLVGDINGGFNITRRVSATTWFRHDKEAANKVDAFLTRWGK